MASFTGPEYIPVWIAGVLSLVGWIATDARSKARAAYMEEKLNGINAEAEKQYASKDAAIALIIIQNTKSETDRIGIHAMLDRLDAQKASRDVVDGFRAEMTTLRNDMERRFDKLERLLEGSLRVVTRRDIEDTKQ